MIWSRPCSSKIVRTIASVFLLLASFAGAFAQSTTDSPHRLQVDSVTVRWSDGVAGAEASALPDDVRAAFSSAF